MPEGEDTDGIDVDGGISEADLVDVDPSIPPPGHIPGASQLPPAAVETIEAVTAAVARLRAEVDATTDRSRRARLLNESGEIQESGGDEQGAARDYLAAYNSDTSFREPLEGLVRLLERRRSLANLGKLIDALVSAAVTPEERARALTLRAVFCEDVQQDLEGARGAAREATESGAVPADLGAAWITLEMVAAKLADGLLREEALAGRAELADDPTWKGLLLVDVARLAARSGDVERAVGITNAARDLGAAATWPAIVAAGRIVEADPGLPGSDDAVKRAVVRAEGLEKQAELAHAATTDAARGDVLGVPRHARDLEVVVDLLARASDFRRGAGDMVGAGRLLDRAIEVVREARPRREDEPTGAGSHAETAHSIVRILQDSRLRLAEQVGDTAMAAELATARMVGEIDGGVVASLAMRVAEHAASENDIGKALEALSIATSRDPVCAPARALKIDILEGTDPARFAEELEELSKHCATGAAQGRSLLLAAYVWAARAADASRAQQALGQAEACGVPKETTARLGRSLASLRGDDEWYEAATRSLIEEKAREASPELPALWVELAHIRLTQNDEAGAAKAASMLRDLEGGAWLGRVLDGLVPWEDGADRSRPALEELVAGVADPTLKRTLATVCAIRAQAAGDTDAAVAHLKVLSEEDPSDPLVSSYLGDLLRAAGRRAEAAQLSRALAETAEKDGELRAARHLEAGIELWDLADKNAAFAQFEAAAAADATSGAAIHSWAARGVEIDQLEGRRRALDLAGTDASVALERFALEATLGDHDAASTALDMLDRASVKELRIAGAIARVVWPSDVASTSAALELLSAQGEAARTAAAAENVLLARDRGEGLAAAAKAWLDAGGEGAAAIEWLAATIADGDQEGEIPARRALAELLHDEAREAMLASAALLEAMIKPEETHPLVAGSSHAVRLANLELSPPGCDPRRRASTLSEVDGALGEESELDALGLAAWSALSAGDAKAALDVFRMVTAARADELSAWEGMRSAGEVLGDHETYAVACEQLGARCTNSSRGASFWEQAALAWGKLGTAFEARSEAALDASIDRDITRGSSFDRLFRRVRDRKDGDKLMRLAVRRLEVSEDPQEIAKLYWEIARVLREKGDPDGALEALEHVVLFDENHVGALALTGEIFIRRGQFAEAAEKLARLARVETAPAKNRITAGVAAVDLYENKLAQHDLALEVLLALHHAKLSTLPVRERLARSAARTGSWKDATRILEELMLERAEPAGRIEAARLAMAIYRDRLHQPAAAVRAVQKLLEEAPADGEAIDLVVGLDAGVRDRQPMLEHARDAILMSLHEQPGDVEQYRRLARVTHTLADPMLEQAALSAALALGGPDGSAEQMIALYASRKPRVPAVGLTPPMIAQVLAPGDDGPLAELFAALGPTLAEALGPQTTAMGVTKKEKVDPRAGLGLRNEIASWAGAFGISSFDLYVGGKDPAGVQGIPGDTPTLVVGSGVNAPLSPATRARVARELFAMSRGTTITRWRDDATIAAIVVAACNIVKVRVDHPPLAVLAEVERLVGKAISRKTKAVIEPICRAYVGSKQDPVQWAARARSSQSRFAVVAAGDVSVVLADVFGEPIQRLGAVARDDLRAHELLRFVLSRPYFELRRALGLEGA